MSVSKFERVIYFLIITVMFFLVLFLYNKMLSGKKGITTFSDDPRLYSFCGINSKGEEEKILFTAYSNKLYIFATISSHCSHCKNFLINCKAFFQNHKIDKSIHLLLLTADSPKPNFIPHANYVRISHDDLIQFGFYTPSIFAVNGQGKILYKNKGYFPGLFEKIIKIINNSTRKKSEPIF